MHLSQCVSPALLLLQGLPLFHPLPHNAQRPTSSACYLPRMEHITTKCECMCAWAGVMGTAKPAEATAAAGAIAGVATGAASLAGGHKQECWHCICNCSMAVGDKGKTSGPQGVLQRA
jgi:hypothetical protein